MALGAYAVIRYSDNLRDERVNLGVVVWHPIDGFAARTSDWLERVRAINPGADPKVLRAQLRMVEDWVRSSNQADKAVLGELAQWLREGLEVTAAYPARMSGMDDAADRLFQTLVPSREREAADKLQTFELRLTHSLFEVVPAIRHDATIEEIGTRYYRQIPVNVGMRVRTPATDMLWRGVSLKTQSTSDQIARAKATSLDILNIRGLLEFANCRQFVAIEKPRKAGALDEARKWIAERAEVVEIAEPQDLPAAIEETLRKVA